MKKVMAAIGLLALASTSHAVTTLGGDEECNFNGESLGFIPFNGTFYLGCEIPDDGSGEYRIAVDDTVILAKNSATLGVDIVWTLPDVVVVGDGDKANATTANVDRTVLQVNPGAQIAGAVNSESALVISRGAKINAVGTEQMPIVFSSLDDNYNGSGEWGGLALAGFGKSNDCPGVAGGPGGCDMEGVDPGHFYGGGEDETESSGRLEYVVIAEGGHVITDGNEINGLTLYAVNGSIDPATDEPYTVIENVHIHNNADDGIEFFGGDAAVNRLWLTCNEDDSVDWDEGYRGAITDLSILQGVGSGGASAGYAFELAGNPTDPTAQPKANGSVTNATVRLDASALGIQSNEVFNLKQGTMGSFTNIEILDYNDTINCDLIDSDSSGSFSDIEYENECNPVDLSSPSAPAAGFTDNTFWTSVPACD